MFLTILAAVCFIAWKQGYFDKALEYLQPADSELEVHYIDVGQGDCIYIASGSENMLIDCGEASEAGKVTEYLQSLGVRKIDRVVGTHPHSDHMGGMSCIIETFDVGEFMIPHIPDEQLPTTVYFNKFLDAVEKYDVKLTEARTGDTFMLNEAECEVIAPNSDRYEGMNNYSIVIFMRHGANTLLFTGDAESESEHEMVQSGRLSKVNVLKAGHHGSATSSSAEFLREISPDAVVISCGKDNSYGHPAQSTLRRLGKYTKNIYRTDKMGTIIICSDGSEIKVRTERKSR